jgi:hypothetical protein
MQETPTKTETCGVRKRTDTFPSHNTLGYRRLRAAHPDGLSVSRVQELCMYPGMSDGLMDPERVNLLRPEMQAFGPFSC